MSVIYLKHAEHGGKVAISEQEAAWDESKGWKRFDPTAKQEEPQKVAPEVEEKQGEAVEVPAAPEPAKKRQYNRRA
jgi:hypothetical protein